MKRNFTKSANVLRTLVEEFGGQSDFENLVSKVSTETDCTRQEIAITIRKMLAKPINRILHPLLERRESTLCITKNGKKYFALLADVRNIESLKKEKYLYDGFICHSSDDKDKFVSPLVGQLSELGYAVWYDKSSMGLGDSIRQKIDSGLSNSRYGIVVLSKSFFKKQWTNYELNGLLSKELAAGKVILPIWLDVTIDEVRKYSPPLADKLSIVVTNSDLSEVVHEVCAVFNGQMEK